MTAWGTPSRSRGAFAPGSCKTVPLVDRGRRECRALDAPAASCAKGNKHTSIVTTVTPGSPGIPRANGFNGLFRTLPGDRAFLSPSLAEGHFRQLDSGVEESGPHGFTVRDQRSRLVRHRVHRIPRPTCRDDRETPLFIGHGISLLYCCFYLFEKRNIFWVPTGQVESR
jgi:hypothetical protein